jgi:hypothetical protein
MATKEEVMKQAYDAYANFITLCRTFFGEKPIDSVQSLDKESEFYKTAQDIAKEFGMDWEKMTMEDSNELTIALLEEYYNRINVSKDFSYNVTLTVKEKKAKGK